MADSRMTVRRRAAAAVMLGAGGAALAGAAPAAAQVPPWNAQPVTGLYIGLGVGANWVQKTSVGLSGTAAGVLRTEGFSSSSSDISFETGVLGLGSVGWGFGNGLRAETEISYRNNGVDNITASGPAAATGRLQGAGGTQQTYALMVNLLYDFQLAAAPWVVPYVGLGVGLGWVDWSGNRVSNATGGATTATVNRTTLSWSDTSMQFAYQAIAGAAFPIDSVPGLALTTEFRFFGTLQPEFDATSTVRSERTGSVLRTGTGTVQTDNYNYAVMIGLRYNFGRVPPPPAVAAPPPAPAPARTYLVFFDWDRADLTDRARQIIAEAAENSRRVQVTRIEVAGHADRSGTPAYNQRLSQRRADSVAGELVARGVARTIITVQAFGESRPLVPTADGVREPQNRRVEIVLR